MHLINKITVIITDPNNCRAIKYLFTVYVYDIKIKWRAVFIFLMGFTKNAVATLSKRQCSCLILSVYKVYAVRVPSVSPC
jgi:hypothetical protein